MKHKVRVSEREYQGHLKNLLKNAFNTEPQQLRSLKTVTKRRRALKKEAAENSGSAKSSTPRSA
jgi:hypothetical protein